MIQKTPFMNKSEVINVILLIQASENWETLTCFYFLELKKIKYKSLLSKIQEINRNEVRS